MRYFSPPHDHCVHAGSVAPPPAPSPLILELMRRLGYLVSQDVMT
eukprot:UN1258